MKRAAIALVALTLLALPARAKEAWFTLQPSLRADWQVTNEAPLRLTIAPTQPGGRVYDVFVLTSKASSSYTIGLNKILEVLAREGARARLVDVNAERDPARMAAALDEIRAGGYDLVFAMGSEAVSYLYAHYRGGKTPVVTVEAKDPVVLGQLDSYSKGSGNNFAFTSLNAPVALQLTYLKTLKPQLKNLAFLYSPLNKSAVETQVKPLAALAQKEGVGVVHVAAGRRDVKSELKVEMPRAIARMRETDPKLESSLFWVVGSTEIFEHMRLVNRLAGRVPVLSAVPDLVVEGPDSAALAIGATFVNNGYLAATYAVAILTGKARPGELKVGVVSPPDIAISFLKTREIGLRVPFEFFEDATRIYDAQGRLVRADGATSPPGH